MKGGRLPVDGDAIIKHAFDDGSLVSVADRGGRYRKVLRSGRKRTSLAKLSPRAEAAMNSVGLDHFKGERKLVAEAVVAIMRVVRDGPTVGGR